LNVDWPSFPNPSVEHYALSVSNLGETRDILAALAAPIANLFQMTLDPWWEVLQNLGQ
jgi:hypothetical protein